MTSVNDISDFARIIREQPEWADTIRSLLLGQELLELPERFAESVQLTTESFKLVNRRIDDLETRMTQEFQLVNRRIDDLETRMTQEFQLVNRRIDDLETRMTQEFQLVNRRIDGLEIRMDRLEGRFGNFEGSDYERRVRTKILFRARNQMGLERPYLALTQDGLVAPQLDRVIAQAIDTGSIDLEQSQDLHDADLIIMGQNNRHAAVEISMTADGEDVTRAKRRAAVLSAATGDAVTAAIITANLPDTERDEAGRQRSNPVHHPVPLNHPPDMRAIS